MIVALGIAGYLGVGIGLAALWLWLGVWRYEEVYGDGIDPALAGLAVAMWPVALIAAVGTIVLRGTLRAVKARDRKRLEALREMEAAEREVERMLRASR